MSDIGSWGAITLVILAVLSLEYVWCGRQLGPHEVDREDHYYE